MSQSSLKEETKKWSKRKKTRKRRWLRKKLLVLDQKCQVNAAHVTASYK